MEYLLSILFKPINKYLGPLLHCMKLGNRQLAAFGWLNFAVADADVAVHCFFVKQKPNQLVSLPIQF